MYPTPSSIRRKPVSTYGRDSSLRDYPGYSATESNELDVISTREETQHHEPGTPEESNEFVTSLDVPSYQKPTRANTRETLQLWAAEIACCALCVLYLVVIVVVLRLFEGQPLPSLPLRITPNTFLAIITSLLKASLMFVVAQAICQWKWNWFKTSRPLDDFQAYDDASRGPWGSLRFLPRFRWHAFATIGSLIYIAGALSSPVTQQMIAFESVSTIVTDGSLGFATSRVSKAYLPPLDFAVDAPIHNAVAKAMVANAEEPLSPTPPHCPSANCTFPLVHTLGVCYKVANVTNALEVTEIPGPSRELWTLSTVFLENSTLPTTVRNISIGYWCNYVLPDDLIIVDCHAPANLSIAFSDDEDMMAGKIDALTIIYSLPVANEDGTPSLEGPFFFFAFEIVWHLCIQTYEVQVRNGTATSLAVTSSYAVDRNLTSGYNSLECTLSSPTGNLGYECRLADLGEPRHRPLVLQGPSRSPTNSSAIEDHFRTDYADVENMAMVMLGDFQVLAAYDPKNERAPYVSGSTATLRVRDALHFGANSTEDQMDNIAQLSETVATSLTNYLRTVPSSNDSQSAFEERGDVWVNETLVRIRWGWLAFLAGEVVLGIIFLVITMMRTKELGVPVLKSSSLAGLFGLGRDTRTLVDPSDGLKTVTAKAKGVRVRLDGRELILDRWNTELLLPQSLERHP